MKMMEILSAVLATHHVSGVINPPQIAPDVLANTSYTRILVFLPV
jgi:hypothetical protein